MLKAIEHFFAGDRILVLGFGMEGRSSVRFLQDHFPALKITVADSNSNLDPGPFGNGTVELLCGAHYLDSIDEFDLVVKSPGVPLSLLQGRTDLKKVTSQTDLFLHMFRELTIGITGTKGKSTTSSLIFRILESAGRKVFLLGNIGRPPLDYVRQIPEDALVVFEMSSHQLDGIQISPHISVFLNLFEEHLDHYGEMGRYRQAKYNIFKHQIGDDWLVFNCDDPDIVPDMQALNITNKKMGFAMHHSGECGAYGSRDGKVSFSGQGYRRVYDFSHRLAMPGSHNLMNILASVCVGELLSVDQDVISSVINSFPGLEHRLEFVGKFRGISFYNDSIATIPEATIEAVKTLGRVDTLILGGKDRGINYNGLVDYLKAHTVPTIVLVGGVGSRLKALFGEMGEADFQLIQIGNFQELADVIRSNTPEGGVCLLSPAASSYDMFKNFEERGRVFKKIAENL